MRVFNVLALAASYVALTGPSTLKAEAGPDRSNPEIVSVVGSAHDPDGNAIETGLIVVPDYDGSSGFRLVAVRDGRFTIRDLPNGETQQIYLFDVTSELGVARTITPRRGLTLDVELLPCAFARVRFVDRAGKPFVQATEGEIGVSFCMLLTQQIGEPPFHAVHGSFLPNNVDLGYSRQRTDGDGWMRFPRLIPGANYSILGNAPVLVEKTGIPIRLGRSVRSEHVWNLGTRGRMPRLHFCPQPGEEIQLGELTIRRPDAREPPLSQPAGTVFPLAPPAKTSAVVALADRLTESLLPRVVKIIRSGRTTGGSGVVVTEEGHVLTAAHCLKHPGDSVAVLFPDGTSAKGTTLGMCSSLDIGVVKITEEGRTWEFAAMAAPNSLRPADWCIAIGYPGEYGDIRPPTPVVRIGRIVTVSEEVVSTTVPLQGGDSGGPLFDLDGRVVAIQNFGSYRAGIDIGPTLSIPIGLYRGNWDRLLRGDYWDVFNRNLGSRFPSADKRAKHFSSDSDKNLTAPKQ